MIIIDVRRQREEDGTDRGAEVNARPRRDRSEDQDGTRAEHEGAAETTTTARETRGYRLFCARRTRRT